MRARNQHQCSNGVWRCIGVYINIISMAGNVYVSNNAISNIVLSGINNVMTSS